MLSVTTEEVLTGEERLAVSRFTRSNCPEHGATVLSLHGAGRADRHRTDWLMRALCRRGMDGVAPDFSGQGDSTGALAGSSLERRLAQARAVCARESPSACKVLVGSSMGAHVAAQLSRELRPSVLLLFCPAAYPRAAQSLPFDASFTRAIRIPQAWRDSLAFEALGAFTGRLVIVSGALDPVIPAGVIPAYLDAARRAQRHWLTIPDAGHSLHAWLQDHPHEQVRVLDVLGPGRCGTCSAARTPTEKSPKKLPR